MDETNDSTANGAGTDASDPLAPTGPEFPGLASRPARSGARIFLRIVGLLIAAASIGAGFEVRHWLFDRAATVHLRDAAIAFDWGNRIVQPGGAGTAPVASWRPFLGNYFSLYDTVRGEHPDGAYGLDLPPLRLLAVGLWARAEHVLGHVDPANPTWDATWRLNAPMQMIGTVAELIAALLLAAIVWLWVGRREQQKLPELRRHEAGWLCGLGAGLLLWLNPALLLDSAGWLQTDSWLLPFFLGAVLLGSLECWTWAGVCLGIGFLVKAQLLFVAPVLLLWPLLTWKPMAALRLLLGMIAACVVLLSPWLIHRSGAWWSIAFAYGLRAHPVMSVDASNLPALLASKAWNWSETDTVWTLRIARLHIEWALRMKALLIAVYSITLVLCAWGAARQSARRNPRVLIGLIAPWILLVTLLPQMHGRYLVWGAALSAGMVGVSLGMTLMCLLITAIATVMVLRPMLETDPTFLPKLTSGLSGLHPHIGWALLMCAVIFLLEAMLGAGGFVRRRRPLEDDEPVILEVDDEQRVIAAAPAPI